MNIYGIYDRVSDELIAGQLYLNKNDESMMRGLLKLPDGMDGENFVLCRLGTLDGLDICPDVVKLCKLSQCQAELDNILAKKDF